jgi:hypothetical protein
MQDFQKQMEQQVAALTYLGDFYGSEINKSQLIDSN